jgi:phosphoribosylformylglycinamidine (FGAM) synthase PurS component
MPLVDVISEVQSGRYTKFIVEKETKNRAHLINEIKFMCNQQLDIIV